MRKEILANGAYYHIYNRGTDKREVFLTDHDRLRFFKSLSVFNSPTSNKAALPRIKTVNLQDKPLIDILCFCLMGNHFHLLVKQVSDFGVSKFMQRLGNGYTKYFNTRYKRSGSLFESTYKLTPVTTTGQLLNTSGYIHRNPLKLPEISGSFEKLKRYRWSSLPTYLEQKDDQITRLCDIMSHFRDPNEYFNYMKVPISNI